MRLQRGVLHDLYVEDGRAAVMVGGDVLVLSPLATTIVLAVPPTGTTTLAAVTSTVIAQFGEPEAGQDAASIVSRHVHDLAAHEVLHLADQTASSISYLSEPETLGAVHGALAAAMHTSSNARWAPPAQLSPSAFLAALHRQRVATQLVTGLDHLGLSDNLRASLEAHAEATRYACAGLALDLHRALDLLRENGVDALVVKGMPLAVQAWRDQAARGYGDLDLFVSPTQLHQAHDALLGGGWTPTQAYPVPGDSWAWRQFVRSDNEISLASGSTMIDLHWHLTPFRSTLPSFEYLWNRRVWVDVGGRPVATLCAYDALAHSAGHSARDRWRWARGLADVHQLAASADTWRVAERPLRPDQLKTLGIAARLFGVPHGAPNIVHEAAAAAGAEWRQALISQLGAEHLPESQRLQGVYLRSSLTTLWLARASPRDYVELFIRCSIPTWHLANAASLAGWVAVPTLVGQRARELAASTKRKVPRLRGEQVQS